MPVPNRAPAPVPAAAPASAAPSSAAQPTGAGTAAAGAGADGSAEARETPKRWCLRNGAGAWRRRAQASATAAATTAEAGVFSLLRRCRRPRSRRRRRRPPPPLQSFQLLLQRRRPPLRPLGFGPQRAAQLVIMLHQLSPDQLVQLLRGMPRGLPRPGPGPRACPAAAAADRRHGLLIRLRCFGELRETRRDARAAQVAQCRRRREATQVETDSKVLKRLITFQVQALSSRRFQRRFDRVKLHRLAVAASTAARRSDPSLSVPYGPTQIAQYVLQPP